MSFASAALACLLVPICEFPFETEQDRAVMVAAMLTAVAAAGLQGCNIPGFCFDATTPGSGKSMLADIAAIIGTGEEASRTPQTGQEEFRKQLLTLLLEGTRFVLIDNITSALGGAALDAVLTSPRFRDRVLGVSQNADLPVDLVVMATGNNLQVKGDLARRVLRCRLTPDMERPEERSDFKIPRLIPWVKENRTSLIAACLTILRGYFVAGHPSVRTARMGSFEDWAQRVRDPLVWLGMPDPVLTQRRVRAESDSGLEAWTEALQALGAAFDSGVSFTTSGLMRSEDAAQVTARDLVGACLTKPLTPSTMGHLFKKHRGRRVQGLRLVRDGRRWSVERSGTEVGG